MIRLSPAAREVIDLARSGALGRRFPSWEEIVRDAEGDLYKIAKSFRQNYGRNVSETDVRAYVKLYEIDIDFN